MVPFHRRSYLWVAAVTVVGILCSSVAVSAQQRRGRGVELRVKEGDPAPSFELTAVVLRDGKPVKTKVRLSDYKGKKNVVLYFFPKASTPG